MFDCHLSDVFIEYSEILAKQSETRATRSNLHLKKNSFVSTPDRRQSKTLFIDELGSEIATTSVFDCHLSTVGQLMAIKDYVSNYFWSTVVDSIDVFVCCLSIVVSLYAS